MWIVRSHVATRLLAKRRLNGEFNRSRRSTFALPSRVESTIARIANHQRTKEDSAALLHADFLELIDRHVQLGSSLRGAVVKAASEANGGPEAIRVVLLHCKAGAPLDYDEVFRDAATRSSDEAFLIRTIVAAGSGGPAASFALQRGAWSLRERHAIRRERRTYASQAVFSARILSWLPLVFGVVMAMTNHSVRDAYLGGIGGFACVAIGVLLNVAGRRWMRSITCSFA